jgi:hypothetical protein
MKIEQLYLTNIIPHLKEFKTCEIYNFELNKLYQELAESMNQKNIYTALDLPDFVNIKEIKLETSIIKLTCKKLKIGNDVNFEKENGIKILNIDDEKYQLIFFPSGSVPEVSIKKEKLIFFMFQPKYQKIYYCGIHTLKKVNSITINNFYKNHCFNDSNKFIDFKNLLR